MFIRTLISATIVAASVSYASAGDISGAGATFPFPIYAKWADAYKKETGNGLNYQNRLRHPEYAELIEGAGFQRKYGALFTNERTGGTRQVDFRRAWDGSKPSAWQVKRKDFDALLAAHAAESGATVRRGVTVEDVLFDGARATGVRIAGPGGKQLT